MFVPAWIAYGRIGLRPFLPADAARVTELCSVRELADMTAVIPYPYTERDAEEWIARCAAAERSEHVYAVLSRSDERLVGAVGLRAEPSATGTLGYWIGQPYWGNGYATDAAAAALALGFSWLELETIRASHLARNPASGRVLAKCGMREVGSESRPHRGGPSEAVRLWAVDRAAWRDWIDR